MMHDNDMNICVHKYEHKNDNKDLHQYT